MDKSVDIIKYNIVELENGDTQLFKRLSTGTRSEEIIHYEKKGSLGNMPVGHVYITTHKTLKDIDENLSLYTKDTNIRFNNFSEILRKAICNWSEEGDKKQRLFDLTEQKISYGLGIDVSWTQLGHDIMGEIMINLGIPIPKTILQTI